MSFTYATITRQYCRLGSSTASTGQVTFALTQSMSNGGQEYGADDPTVVQLDHTGLMTVTLPSTVDPGTTPDGAQYTVTEEIDGGEQVWTITVPSGGGTIDLASLLPSVVA